MDAINLILKGNKIPKEKDSIIQDITNLFPYVFDKIENNQPIENPIIKRKLNVIKKALNDLDSITKNLPLPSEEAIWRQIQRTLR
tara:strand:+ start:70 stop:324 length:255 start_codon:yes stop_codon:yes gene_type:complete